MAQGPHITAIPGTRHRSYLHENCESPAIHLTPEDMAFIDTVVKENKVKGQRYPEELMKEYQLND